MVTTCRRAADQPVGPAARSELRDQQARAQEREQQGGAVLTHPGTDLAADPLAVEPSVAYWARGA